MENLLEKEESKNLSEKEWTKTEIAEDLAESPFWTQLSAEDKEEVVETVNKILLKNKTERNN